MALEGVERRLALGFLRELAGGLACEFLCEGRNLHGLNFPPVTKERVPVLSSQSAHVWGRG